MNRLKSLEKTNAIRVVEQNKIAYNVYDYPHEDGVFVDGQAVAKLLNIDAARVFKTILLTSNRKYYVCLVPVLTEIDLKKVASVLKIKSVEMLHVKDLFSITGYVRGGCSPIGMKKKFPTIVDISALNFDKIVFSAGKIGVQLEMNPTDLAKIVDVKFEMIVR